MTMNDKICTPFELKEFAYRDYTTAFDFLKFIESYSEGKYTVVEKQLIEDAMQALSYYITFATDVNDTFKRKWRDTLRILE